MKAKNVLALLVVSALLASCGDDGGPTAPTTATTTTTSVPASAEINIELLNYGAWMSGQGNLFQVVVRIVESGGVGANINFACVEIFRATGELEERQEIGADDIIAGVGDNRLEANTTEEATITFFFRATVKRGRQLRLTMGFTDDNGNDHECVEDFVFT